MDVALLVIGGGVALILLATVGAWRTSSTRRPIRGADDGGPGYVYSGDSFSGGSSGAECGDSGGGSDAGAGCDGGGGDGGGGGGD